MEALGVAVQDGFGTPEIVVNCAGILQSGKRVLDQPLEEDEQLWRINYRGTLLGCQVFGRLMAAAGRGASAELPDPANADRVIPLPGIRKEERIGRIGEHLEAAERAEREEHWRLLYVAMTRAEEALFIGGSLGPKRADKGPHEDSWYARQGATP